MRVNTRDINSTRGTSSLSGTFNFDSCSIPPHGIIGGGVGGGGGRFSCVQMNVHISPTGDAEDGCVWQHSRGVQSL